MNRLRNIFQLLLRSLFNLLAQEDLLVKKILAFNDSEMFQILPKSTRTIDKKCIAIFDYRNKTVKTIVKNIKFKNNLYLKKRVALYLKDELLSICSEIETFSNQKPLIIPIPMSKKEIRSRGFNQCEQICREITKISKDFDIKFNILRKIKETQRQIRLNREERIKNLNMSFVAEPSITVSGRIVIVIDDVYTTGATFKEAERALKKSGAKEVFGLFLAH